MTNPRDRESGQTMVEFMLTLMLAVSVVAIMSMAFRKSLGVFWRGMFREVAAPCPKCKFQR